MGDRATEVQRRAVVAGLAALVLVSVAGCTGDGGAATGDPLSSTGATGSTSSSAPTVTASGPPSTGGSPTATASIAQPPDPVVAAGNAAAWTLTRAAPGAEQSRQVPAVRCGQDGSVTADGLRLAAGAASLTLTDPAVTVTGTADLDAGGGTFRGRDADTAVAFTWVC